MDTENMFLAICEDRPHDPEGYCYTVYFANNTNDIIDQMTIEMGGHMTDGARRHCIIPGKSIFSQIKDKSFIELEYEKEDCFDFQLYFHMTLVIKNQEITKHFSINRYLLNIPRLDDIPLIHQPGYVITAVE
ncbi:hypothetical protein EV207_1137 [Scopulibacillus darangshiensis]|uniref:Uncharacterized protein n=1 Tax=Scopulibacillus darangshiensis TaxID=442528 RepID=A0A4R2P4J6_9BACL|nr:hypothetical protein [Scopulibacillus darangshiensis]TCP28974.1 hypothetical protein EV207_1137 [Scopulibacillus darangshiensis]